MPPAFNLPHDLGSFGIKQLHANLHKGLFRLPGKLLQKVQGLLPAGKIAGYDDVFTHGAHLL